MCLRYQPTNLMSKEEQFIRAAIAKDEEFIKDLFTRKPNGTQLRPWVKVGLGALGFLLIWRYFHRQFESLIATFILLLLIILVAAIYTLA
jgi:hypothetical protein